MGQTQILMIILAVIIIGIAVTVGITQFGESSLAANRDAVAGDCQRVIALSQQWAKKPASLGGGGNAFTGLTLAAIGVGATNANGAVALAVGDENTITCTGTGNEKTSAGAAVTVTMVYNLGDANPTTTDNMAPEE
jgi:type II secretory pathway pseudopilin PulG